jgi:hypothetical protein
MEILCNFAENFAASQGSGKLNEDSASPNAPLSVRNDRLVRGWSMLDKSGPIGKPPKDESSKYLLRFHLSHENNYHFKAT